MTEFEAKILSEMSEIKTDITYLKEKDIATDSALESFETKHIDPMRKCLFGNGKKGLTEKVRFLEAKMAGVAIVILIFKDFILDRILGK